MWVELGTQSLLLLGPTGAGKSPLGAYLEQNGFRGRRCVHMDFGASLREIADGKACDGLTDADVAVVRESLATGALLENENFHIARKIVERFVARKSVGKNDYVVLNGLPRHVDQARDADDFLEMVLVIHLVCAPETVMRRIRRNTGGDRTGRPDDDLEFVRRKLAIFEARTTPILDHYLAKGVRVYTVRVEENTGPSEMVKKMLYGRNGERERVNEDGNQD